MKSGKGSKEGISKRTVKTEVPELIVEGWEDRVLSRVAAREIVGIVMKDLSPSYAEVVEKKFLSGERISLEEIGIEMGVSGDRAREILHTAISKIYRKAQSAGIKDFFS